MKNSIIVLTILALCFFPGSCGPAAKDETAPMTAAGKPAEGLLEPFLGEPGFEMQQVFDGERFPNMAVTTRGTVLATWGGWNDPPGTYKVRRSEDGGNTWEQKIAIRKPGFHGGGVVVDEKTGDIIVFVNHRHPTREPQKTMGPLTVYRSNDDGKTWTEADVVIHPDINGYVPAMHMNERGITLRHGKHAGRLIRPARVYTRDRVYSYSTAIYSDDSGLSWHPGAPFPVFGTGESAVAELSDGRIYFSTRKSHCDDFRHERFFAWSYDGGVTWQDAGRALALPDGPRYRGEERRGANYQGHFGMFAGLVRLPVQGKDILLYSNADTPCHERIRGTVWGSFDGGQTWPIRRLVHEGPFAYSSLAAGRPGTPSEGWAYMLFEGGDDYRHEGGRMARFNLCWLLGGELTGDGKVPEWIR